MLGRRYFNTLNITAQVFDLNLLLQQVGFYACRVGIRQINFIDCDNHWNTRRFDMVNRFNRLWHNSVVCCYN